MSPELEGLTPVPQGGVTSAAGFRAAGVACGIKESGRADLALVASGADCTAAGVFTSNQVVAAPVLTSRETLAANRERIRGVVINAGNANACTGAQGLAAAAAMQQASATQLDCAAGQVLVMSTGVIGVQLPIDRVLAGITSASQALSTSGGQAAAEAIMTTDTRPKQAAVVLDFPEGRVTVGGMAKGSGMIHPNMATLLGVLTTDAAVPAELLAVCLRLAVDQSFNAISVDGDTSTNDAVVLLANGASGVAIDSGERLDRFAGALDAVCRELAWAIVGDGEGATRFIEFRVSGAISDDEARQVAATVVTSPLVKTAFAGGDPNWGRILAAAGRSAANVDQHRLGLSAGIDDAGELALVSDGAPTGFSEAAADVIFAAPAFKLHLDLGLGNGEATMWTTDLTHDYVSINADYRT